MAGRSVLEVRGLIAGYGSGDILHCVDLEIEPGEIVATIGRNGVGKSTFMKTLIGLLPARSGSISFNGRPITNLPPHQRAGLGMGYVPQGRDIFPELTVEENLLMGEGINQAKSMPRYDLVYAYFPILHARRRQLAGTFSGGQQQMLAIGRALVGRPKLLLLDEPSLGIQPSIVEEIGESLTKLNREEGLSILLVEQNVGLISHMAQRAYAMDKGSVVATLTGDALQHREVLVEHLAI